MLSYGAKTRAFGCFVAALLLSAAALAGPPPASKAAAFALVPGESLRYLLEYRSTIQSQSAGPIYTSSQAHQLQISLGAHIRLDVLQTKTDSKQGPLTRLRATYETCDATVQSDAYDPGAQALEKAYRGLRGHSFEFTIDSQGRVRDITGLERLEPDERARSAIRQWLSTITLPLGLWQPGLKPGKKWSRDVPFARAPLAGLIWRTRSSYRDDEPCPSPAGAQRETCAVITTQLDTVRDSHGDPTPPAYRRQGLKTSGRWTARGESLSYVSLSTGLVTSTTATENAAMDLTIASELSRSRLRYAGQSQSRSQIALLAVTFPDRKHSGASHSGSSAGQ